MFQWFKLDIYKRSNESSSFLLAVFDLPAKIAIYFLFHFILKLLNCLLLVLLSFSFTAIGFCSPLVPPLLSFFSVFSMFQSVSDSLKLCPWKKHCKEDCEKQVVSLCNDLVAFLFSVERV